MVSLAVDSLACTKDGELHVGPNQCNLIRALVQNYVSVLDLSRKSVIDHQADLFGKIQEAEGPLLPGENFQGVEHFRVVFQRLKLSTGMFVGWQIRSGEKKILIYRPDCQFAMVKAKCNISSRVFTMFLTREITLKTFSPGAHAPYHVSHHPQVLAWNVS